MRTLSASILFIAVFFLLVYFVISMAEVIKTLFTFFAYILTEGNVYG